MSLFKKKISNISSRRQSHSVVSEDTFRRNRTIVGSTSSSLNSTNVIRSGLQSPRTHVHHLSSVRRKVGGVLLGMLASCLILWLLISNFTATPLIVVSGAPLLNNVKSEPYAEVIQDYLQSNPIARFNFLLNQENLSIYATSKLPEVEKVTLKGMGQVGKTNFIVKMREPVAGWEIEGKKYYVDDKGVSFQVNYYGEPKVQIADNSGVPLQAGKTSVSKRFLGFVGRVVAQAATSGYIVTKATLPAGTMRQLDINIKDIGYVIKLSIDRPVGEQVEDMSRALQYFKSRAMSPAYIDVRVQNKAYYK